MSEKEDSGGDVGGNKILDSNKRKCKFNENIRSKYLCFIQGRIETEAKCIVCDFYVSIASGCVLDLERHTRTTKHTRCFQKFMFIYYSNKLFCTKN